MKKFKKVVILDTVIFYPEHRVLLNSLAEETVEFPSSLPEGLEQQYNDSPELFKDKKCYTQIATDNIPLQILMGRIEGADAVISCWTNIPDEILRLNPQLKVIIFWTHEKEHRINMKLADELGIQVLNVPDYGTDAVAEVVFAGLWKLLMRNFETEKTRSEIELAHTIANETFEFFRMLTRNEKNTRSGKFTHHFHKLGKAKFNFDEQSLEELIPERLIEHKQIGLLELPIEKISRVLGAFGSHVVGYKINDTNSAEFYKFFAESDVVFYDSASKPEGLEKAKKMFGKKMIDIVNAKTTNIDFTQKTFGVIGLGRIGIKVARFAKSLGFNVVYSSKTRKEHLEKELGISFLPLMDLMKSSDVVSIHVPAHKAENLVNAEAINAMKPGTIFINTADGNALDQDALSKRMAANEVFAFLDVYPGLPRKDIMSLPMEDKTDWKLKDAMSSHVLAYRAGWKTQESIRVKTYKLLGEMIDTN